MKANFCIFKFALVIGLGLSLASCGNKKPDVSSTAQPSPVQSLDTNPQASVEATNTPTASEPEICKTARTTSECARAKLQLREVELKQILDRLVSESGNVVPLERDQPLKNDISAAQQAWLKYRDKSCDLQIALSQTGRRAARGSTLDAIRADCKAGMNEERIVELSEITEGQRSSSSGSPTTDTSSTTSKTLRVQNLSDGDSFFASGEPPRYFGDIFLFRKQGNIVIGWGANNPGEGSCLRKVISSDSQVKTTKVTVDAYGGKGKVKIDREVSVDDGSFGNSELSQVDVDQYPNFDERVQGCAKQFSN